MRQFEPLNVSACQDGLCACDWPSDPDATCLTAGQLLDMCQYLSDNTAITQNPQTDVVDECVAEIEAEACGLGEIFDACMGSGDVQCGGPCDDLGAFQACVSAGGTNCFFASIANC